MFRLCEKYILSKLIITYTVELNNVKHTFAITIPQVISNKSEVDIFQLL